MSFPETYSYLQYQEYCASKIAWDPQHKEEYEAFQASIETEMDPEKTTHAAPFEAFSYFLLSQEAKKGDRAARALFRQAMRPREYDVENYSRWARTSTLTPLQQERYLALVQKSLQGGLGRLSPPTSVKLFCTLLEVEAPLGKGLDLCFEEGDSGDAMSQIDTFCATLSDESEYCDPFEFKHRVKEYLERGKRPSSTPERLWISFHKEKLCKERALHLEAVFSKLMKSHQSVYEPSFYSEWLLGSALNEEEVGAIEKALPVIEEGAADTGGRLSPFSALEGAEAVEKLAETHRMFAGSYWACVSTRGTSV